MIWKRFSIKKNWNLWSKCSIFHNYRCVFSRFLLKKCSPTTICVRCLSQVPHSPVKTPSSRNPTIRWFLNNKWLIESNWMGNKLTRWKCGALVFDTNLMLAAVFCTDRHSNGRVRCFDVDRCFAQIAGVGGTIRLTVSVSKYQSVLREDLSHTNK